MVQLVQVNYLILVSLPSLNKYLDFNPMCATYIWCVVHIDINMSYNI